MKTTKSVKNEDFQPGGIYQRAWHLVDAEGKTLGRLASGIAMVLTGKNKPIYTPHVDAGDYVVVVNADKVRLTGTKVKDKMYYHHTGYPGGIKAANAKDLLEKKPEALLEKAVKGMMPKNQLGRDSLRKLKVFSGPDHDHAANNPQPLEI